MRKANQDEYSGIEDFTLKKKRRKQGEEDYSQVPEEEKKQRRFPIERLKAKKALPWIAAAVFLVILMLVLLFKFVITNDKDTAEEQHFQTPLTDDTGRTFFCFHSVFFRKACYTVSIR